MQNDVTIPLELFDGRFSLEEIATMSMILASPHLSLKTRSQWGGNPTCEAITDKLISDGIIKFHEDRIEIDITEKQEEPMNIKERILEIFRSNQDFSTTVDELTNLVENIGHESFGSGYEKGYDDGRIDFAEPSFTSYGKKEDYV